MKIWIVHFNETIKSKPINQGINPINKRNKPDLKRDKPYQ